MEVVNPSAGGGAEVVSTGHNGGNFENVFLHSNLTRDVLAANKDSVVAALGVQHAAVTTVKDAEISTLTAVKDAAMFAAAEARKQGEDTRALLQRHREVDQEAARADDKALIAALKAKLGII